MSGIIHKPECGHTPVACECGKPKPFVPQLPKVVHGPLPDKLPQFEGIDYPIGGKPE